MIAWILVESSLTKTAITLVLFEISEKFNFWHTQKTLAFQEYAKIKLTLIAEIPKYAKIDTR